VHVVLDKDRGERRVEDVAAAAMAPVEAAGVAAVEPMDRAAEHLVVEPREQVVVGRHETESTADEELRGHELSKDLHAGVVVEVISKNVLLRDRARCDVVVACVRWAHVLSMPA
jgi:hypothetical protein